MNKTEINEIEVNGVAYVKKDSVSNVAPSIDLDGMKYVVVRSRDSGCHAGYLESREGCEVKLINSRRLWYWDGAFTLSQLAMEGVNEPDNCKFAMKVTGITVIGVCEVISTTEKAQKSIESVKEWKK